MKTQNSSGIEAHAIFRNILCWCSLYVTYFAFFNPSSSFFLSCIFYLFIYFFIELVLWFENRTSRPLSAPRLYLAASDVHAGL